jgi:DNA invertase Pin-like site-specific DNA recombinase
LTASANSVVLGLRSAPITLSRLAIVYVRQSSAQQIFDHKESRERQYALAEYAALLGWPRERILVIDADQGRSGRTAEQRPGFQHLLAEVSMDHVGVVLVSFSLDHI